MKAGFRYLTLSHRWGDHRILCLRTDNIEEMRRRVLEPAISKTFREAMLVVKALGERYIWIDSLCIIQDSPNRSDWFEESAKMHAIYANAFCNISATGAFDGRDGCFFDRYPFCVQPLRIEIARDGIPHLPGGIYFCVDWDIWCTNIDNAPLTLRAWVVQERLLSKRVLHFGQRQIFWECQESQSCETFPYSVPPRLQRERRNIHSAMNPDIVETQVTIPQGQSRHELHAYALWNSIVETYTRADLTMEDDKLVAIMGLAQHVQKLLDQKYFAGLWEKHFADQLLWSPSSENFKPRKYIAPSWSWASSIGPIYAWSIKNVTSDDTIIQIVNVDVKTVNDHPLSQVTSGSLRLRGSLVRGSIGKKFWKEWEVGSPVGGVGDPQFSLKYDVYDNGRLEQVDYEPHLDDKLDYSDIVYALPVKRAWGLVLQLTGQRIREFRRVGYFSSRELDVRNACTCYIPFEGADPLSADDLWLDGFKLDGRTSDTLTII